MNDKYNQKDITAKYYTYVELEDIKAKARQDERERIKDIMDRMGYDGTVNIYYLRKEIDKADGELQL